jgi:hypothetical protein
MISSQLLASIQSPFRRDDMVGFIDSKACFLKNEREASRRVATSGIIGWLRLLLFILFIPSLMSCAPTRPARTPEWLRVDMECEKSSSQRVPPNYQTTTREMTYMTNEPTDEIKCITTPQFFGGTETRCSPIRSPVWRTQPVQQRVDLNGERLNQAIRSCIVETCNNLYGNPDCKT